MTAPREPFVAPQETARDVQPEWHKMYRAMMAELMAKVETMVDRAVAAHIEALISSHESVQEAVGETAVFDHPPRAVAPPAPAAAPAGTQRLAAVEPAAVPLAPAASPYIQDVRLRPPVPAEAPNWLQLFTMPDQVRFTRTPDFVLQYERARQQAPEPEPVIEPEPIAPVPPPEAAVPLWRRPFSVPPNVRFTRTPDRKRLPEPPPAPPVPTNVAIPMDEEERAFDVMAAQAIDSAAAADAADERAYQAQADGSAGFEPAVPASRATATWLGTIWQGQQEAFRSVYEQDNEVDLQDSPSALEEAGRVKESIARYIASVANEDEAAAMAEAAELAAEEPFIERGGEGFGADGARLGWAPPDLAPVEFAPPASARNDASRDDLAQAAMAGSDSDAGDPGRRDSDPRDFGRSDLDRGNLDRGDVEPVASPPAIQAPKASVVQLAPVRLLRQAPAAASNLTPFAKRKRVAVDPDTWEYPPMELLAEPVKPKGIEITGEMLEQNARLLEGVLEDFAIRGEIINVRPGPVVTLYELEPAPGIKSSRVIGLSDDIARSMSAISARVAVVQGRNVIGIELPNERRETVFLRELAASEEFSSSKHKLAIALGKTIGGEPVIVDLARMPHLLVAGTTGSGKSVAINTMILSLLYRLRPDECRLIMVDPKMLELSVYDGIPHLLTPVVTDPKKAVVALKWAVREMEDRYKKMSKVAVRNIDGFNQRVGEARRRGEVITRTVQTGYDRTTGEPVFETEEMDLAPIPYIVIIVDEMADLMMVAGKDIEGAIQRLAQMARAAGIHLIMATQRPSVDVITGTIKANFPTRISFQVTSKIDSRTILGEQGAEQLLGQGDMLHMMGGGRIARVHGPFVSDGEVEQIVAHLKTQGHPDYLDVTTEEGAEEADPEASEEKGAADKGGVDKNAFTAEDNELYEQAVKVVLRDKKCSTSYIQRRLQVGYNKAASLVERMEKNGMVGPANHAGKREILVYSRDLRMADAGRDEE